jgi:ABC-type uncharacterized transport system YnjBCD ATPase subunit
LTEQGDIPALLVTHDAEDVADAAALSSIAPPI